MKLSIHREGTPEDGGIVRAVKGLRERLPKRKGGPGKKWSKKRLILSSVAIALVLAGGVGVYALFFTEEERVAVTGETTYGYLNEALEGSGTTTPADSVTYTISGTVLEWHVETGDNVEEGDLLYVLDASEVEDEMMEYELELTDLYEQYEELEDNVSNQRVTADFSGRIEDIQVEAGDNVQNGTMLATLVDDSTMKATLYFSYAYEEEIYEGMAVTVSVPDQMLTLSGTVTDIQYVNYVTSEGMSCFAVTVSVPNPGSLAEGMGATCWLTGSGGSEIYAAGEAELAYSQEETITAGATGELLAVYVTDYEEVTAGQALFSIDASSYESQLESVLEQIEYYEERIVDLQESIDTEYTRYADITGQVVYADYSTDRMTGEDSGTVMIYNQESMEITVNIDELNVDYVEEGMEVTVYRTTSSSSEPVYYPATLTYLSLEATSSTSGVSTFEATITIDSAGELSSGVTVYYIIDTSGGSGESVLAPIDALCTYDDGYYLLVASDSRPESTIDPAEAGGSVTDYPDGYYAVPVEVGDYNESYVQILSGVEEGTEVFLRYQNAAPSGGDTTSTDGSGDSGSSGFPGGGDFQMPSGGMGSMGGGMMGGMPGGR